MATLLDKQIGLFLTWTLTVCLFSAPACAYVPDYNIYHNLSQIYAQISDLAERNPSYVQLDNSYRSRNNLPQVLVRLSNFSDSRDLLERSNPYWNSAKVKVLLSYGEHAREFFPVESFFYLIRNITDGLTAARDSPEETFSRLVLTKVDLFIVVILNPDGRSYIERNHDYCWRGTGTGVDLNRNFDWNYGGKGSDKKPYSEEMRGSNPFSEPECHVLLDLTRKHHFDAFMSFHSGIREIYIPFADSRSKSLNLKPTNLEAMSELAKQMSEVTHPHFVYGQAYYVNRYPADGTVFDYMAGVKKIPFSFAIELWGEGDLPGKECFHLFNPPSEDLEESLKAIHPMYERMFLYLIHWKERQIRYVFSIENDGPSLFLCLLMLLIVVLVTLLFACQSRLPERMRFYPRRRVISLKSLSSTLHIS